MDFWINFWTIVLVAGIVMFGILAVIVVFGGASDIRKLFRSIEQQHQSKRSMKDEG